MKTTVEILEGALEIMKDPTRWAQHGFAFSAEGTRVCATSPSAVKWCVVGAMYHVAETYDGNSDTDVARRAVLVHGFGLTEAQAEATPSLSHYNDSLLHRDIVVAVEKTIAALKAQKESQP